MGGRVTGLGGIEREGEMRLGLREWIEREGERERDRAGRG